MGSSEPIRKEEFRDPVVRPDFKSGRGCQQSLVGSTPMLFRRACSMNFDLGALPADLLYAAEEDMWVRVEPDGKTTVGTTHLVAAHGQFVFFAPRPAGTEIARGRSLGVMETAKTAVAIHAPLSCRIIEANPAVERDATLITKEPYEAAWLFRIEPTALEAERATLMDVTQYRAWLAPRLDRFKPPIDDDAEDRSSFGRFY
jgi:glycine cleavage system H protein